MSAPAPAPGPAVLECRGWRFEADVRPMWISDRIDELAREQNLCKIPDMFYGDAALRIRHSDTSTAIELGSIDALRCCSWQPPPPEPLQPPRSAINGIVSADGPLLGGVQCQFAGQWRPQSENPDVKELTVTSDWTCSTAYWGSIYRAEDDDRVPLGNMDPTDEELPLELLRRRDEILWYQEVPLWEDELADNGLCRLSVRVRVMPTFWFALCLCELRVDNVLIREVATRLFCSFGSDHVLREWTWKEASYEALRKRGVNFNDNPHVSHTSIGTSLLEPEDVKRQLRHKIRLGGAAADPADEVGTAPPAPQTG